MGRFPAVRQRNSSRRLTGLAAIRVSTSLRYANASTGSTPCRLREATKPAGAAPVRSLRHSRASGNPRQGGLFPSFPRAARPDTAACGRAGARPVGARGVSLDPRFRGGDDTGRDGSSRAPTRPCVIPAQAGIDDKPDFPSFPYKRQHATRPRPLRHSRASGNPGEVGFARPPGPRHVGPSRAPWNGSRASGRRP